MGLSSSKTTAKVNQATTGNETTSGTTQPLVPDYLLGPAQDYFSRIGAFGDMDPNSFVAPASPLQQMAWQNVGNLSGWQGQAQTAAQMAQKAGNSGPQIAQPPFPGGLVPGQGYSAPQLGPSQGYAAARTGSPIGAASAAAAQHMGAYQNPYQQQVIDTTLADYDQGTAQQQARLAAAGARNGAFGGSRFGIAEGQLAADSARGRAATAAQLRSQGFNTAAALGAQDADRANATNLFNADAGNRFALDQAGREDQAGQFNSSLAQQRALAQGGFDQSAGQFNSDLASRVGMFNAGQGDTAQQRALQAAQLLQAGAGQYAGDTRADLGTMAALGDQQRQIEQSYALSPLAQLQAMGQLGQFPFQALVGQQIDGTTNTAGTMNGTTVQKSSPSLFNQLLTAGQFASSFF